MNKQPPSIKVEQLRQLLDANDIEWREVRGEPNCTYLPTTYHSIWWQGPAILAFKWGHNFEHTHLTPGEVLAQLLKEFPNG